MKKLLLALCAVAVCFPLGLAGQDKATIEKALTGLLVEYTRLLPIDGLPLSVIHLNDRTVPIIFQPPTLYSMRARVKEATLIYVQGTVTRNIELDTTKFTLSQNGQATPATVSNIKNFMRGKNKLATGDRVDGLLTFARLVDLANPFTVQYDKELTAEFKFTANEIKAMTPVVIPDAPAPAPAPAPATGRQ
jgi:hypothetical protein